MEGGSSFSCWLKGRAKGTGKRERERKRETLICGRRKSEWKEKEREGLFVAKKREGEGRRGVHLW